MPTSTPAHQPLGNNVRCKNVLPDPDGILEPISIRLQQAILQVNEEQLRAALSAEILP